MERASGVATSIFQKLKAWVYERVTSLWSKIKEMVVAKWYMVIPIAIAAIAFVIFVLPSLLPIIGSAIPMIFRGVMKWVISTIKAVRNFLTGMVRAIPRRSTA